MGRAKGRQVQLFTSVLGPTRGRGEANSLGSLPLTVLAKEEIRELVNEARLGRLDEPLAAVQSNLGFLQQPHFQRLADAIIIPLVKTTEENERTQVRTALDLVGVHRVFAAQLIYVMATGVMHIWPDGETLTVDEVHDKKISSRTVCGLDITDLLTAGVPRGDWRTYAKARPNMICIDCGPHSQDFWETAERVRYPEVLPPAPLEKAFKLVDSELRKLLALGALTNEERARDLAREGWRAQLRDRAQEMYTQRPEWVLQRLRDQGYKRLLSCLEVSGDLSQYLQAHEYGEIVAATLDRDLGVSSDVDERWVFEALEEKMSANLVAAS